MLALLYTLSLIGLARVCGGFNFFFYANHFNSGQKSENESGVINKADFVQRFKMLTYKGMGILWYYA